MAEESPRLPDPQRELITPEGFTPAADAERRQSKQRAWFWLLLVTAALLGVILFLLPPAGFWSKLSAIGYSVCHQIPERSFFAHEHQFPLCARCTGMYLGALLTLLVQLVRGRQSKFPPLAVIIALGALFLIFAADGINSFAGAFLPFPLLYQTTNLLRLATGFGAGICIGAVLAPLFHQSVWSDPIPTAFLGNLPRLFALIGAAGLLGWAVYSGSDWLKIPLAVLSAFSVILVLTLAHTILAVILLNRANQYHRWQELRLPLAIGLCAALAQIVLLDLLRLWLTGTWAALNL
ncbi:MAG TPA: DUF2085 domain-containing protein [Anaerolineaceae bacterium]|nr:DUF2085 domain-containing protein [Anaerolineaceae bacterium]HOA21519.1 DUF2085 domain-containing protein [Anaerolineaceae bacterium]HOG77298.1 DUF2085 domain-containing protein [Anaerolineaceae bacterium]